MDIDVQAKFPLKVHPGTLSRADFVARFGHVYEHSPWVAERAFDKGRMGQCETPADISAVMSEVLKGASEAEQAALIRAHPDLAGKLALDGGLTAESTSEQAGAGLDKCTPAELEQFQTLNRAYTEKFQFPFIMAVKFSTRVEILSTFHKRIENAYMVEFETALDEINKIALIRLLDL